MAGWNFFNSHPSCVKEKIQEWRREGVGETRRTYAKLTTEMS